MTDRVTVSVEFGGDYVYEIDETDIPDGQTIEDVAHNRALEDAKGDLLDYPGAYLTTEDIEPADE